MTKMEFLAAIREGLKGLPKEDVDRAIEYYDEVLSDRIEEGQTEEEAVAAMPSIEEIRQRTLEEIPLTKLVGAKLKGQGKKSGWTIALLIVGSPVWGALLLAAAGGILSIYLTVWALVPMAFGVTLTWGVSGVVGVLGTGWFLVFSHTATAFLSLGCGLALTGLAILGYFGSILLTKGIWKLNKATVLTIKRCFTKKEEKQ